MSKSKEERKPLSKKTLALLDQLKRKRGIRELKKRFLIVCEDGKSAPNYFEALKKHLNLSATSIRVVGSGGSTQPIQVVTRAVELKKNAADAESGTVPFDQVWCVIDGDYGNKIANARAKATANDVNLAISTMCFEYWLLLHYEANDSSTMDCDTLVTSLREKHLPGYDKGKCEFHDTVKKVEDAAARLEVAEAGHQAWRITRESKSVQRTLQVDQRDQNRGSRRKWTVGQNVGLVLPDAASRA